MSPQIDVRKLDRVGDLVAVTGIRPEIESCLFLEVKAIERAIDRREPVEVIVGLRVETSAEFASNRPLRLSNHRGYEGLFDWTRWKPGWLFRPPIRRTTHHPFITGLGLT